MRKLRRWWDRVRAPWPIISECHSGYVAGHRCEQCHPTHRHKWKAWSKAPRWVKSGPGVPVRCRVCGGRKCDYSDCSLMRHTHTHDSVRAIPTTGETK